MTKQYHQCPHCKRLVDEEDKISVYTTDEILQIIGLSNPVD